MINKKRLYQLILREMKLVLLKEVYQNRPMGYGELAWKLGFQHGVDGHDEGFDPEVLNQMGPKVAEVVLHMYQNGFQAGARSKITNNGIDDTELEWN